MRSAFTGRGSFVLSCIVLIALLAAHFWPTSWWLQVESVRVDDAQTNQPVRMYVDRRIHRPFSATWSATIREVSDGYERLSCTAASLSDYKPAAKLPTNVTLGWWTNGACKTLPEGAYVLTTTWLIHTGSLVPDKTLTVSSNLFKVTP